MYRVLPPSRLILSYFKNRYQWYSTAIRVHGVREGGIDTLSPTRHRSHGEQHPAADTARVCTPCTRIAVWRPGGGKP
jgi:hypothetical protein